MKINAKEAGTSLLITPEGMRELGIKGLERVTNMASPTVWEPGERPENPPIRRKLKFYESLPGGYLRIPKTVVSKLPKEWEWDIEPGDAERIPLSLRPIPLLPHTLDPLQMEILQKVRDHRSGGGVIHAAMGAGKSWMLMALVLGHPLLRPCAISGKGDKDTRQLIEKLRAFHLAHPERAEPVMLSGLGRSLSKKDHKILAENQGIIVCTHAGLKNLPVHTKLLILDEGHAACTAKRLEAIWKISGLKKTYALSGTVGLRGDGGDEALAMLAGPEIISKGHQEFEATGRVAPAWINAYLFWGKAMYAVNPFMPDQSPQEGYSLHATWVENHRGRHQFVADLIHWLPKENRKLIFVPHILHAVRLAKAIEEKNRSDAKNLSESERSLLKPVIFHAKADKGEKFYMSPQEREEKLRALEEGKIHVAISTDFLSTGFDTNMIDDIIDAGGQKAIIRNIQQSGRGIRPRIREDGSAKILQIHTILDKTHPLLHKLGERRYAAICAYYGHTEGASKPDREGGCRRFSSPPWLGGDKPHQDQEDPPESQWDPASFKRQ
jgi:hypothetical protein